MPHSNPKEVLHAIIDASLGQMDPTNIFTRQVSFNPRTRTLTVKGEPFSVETDQGIWIMGSGKASAAMAEAIESIPNLVIRDGLVITPSDTTRKLKSVQLLKGAHPIPDKNSLAATYELIDFARKIPEGDVVIFLISGGTSALLCLPADNLEQKDLAITHRLLLKSGADIHEMNTIRTVLSGVKGGQLLRYLSHVRLIDLIISDVPGDEFRTIGSGPTSPGVIDYNRAFHILKKYELWNRIPHESRAYIARGMHNQKSSQISDNLKEHRQFLVSSASMLAEEVAEQCQKYGYEPVINHPAYNISIQELERKIIDKIRQNKSAMKNKMSSLISAEKGEDDPNNRKVQKKKTLTIKSRQALIFYGESSVNVTGSGKGGRNQELALRIVRHLKPGEEITFASVGTDGVDGPTDSAGAIVDGQTLNNAREKNIDPDTFLSNNDSWNFFDQVGGHIKTGPTGNNLMDLQIVLIGK